MATQQQQWMDPAAYGAYQADNTSSESMSDEANAGDAAASSCRFTHNQCEKELFTTEYLR